MTDASIRKGINNLGSRTFEDEVEVKRQKIQEGRSPLDGVTNFGSRKTLREHQTLKEEGETQGSQSKYPEGQKVMRVVIAYDG